VCYWYTGLTVTRCMITITKCSVSEIIVLVCSTVCPATVQQQLCFWIYGMSCKLQWWIFLIILGPIKIH